MPESPALTREQLDSLADHIAQLSLRIDLAKHAFLTALRQFSAYGGWADSGFPTLVGWLSWRAGISPTTAREYVRVAKALGEFPRIDTAFSRGELSYAKVRAMTRAASPATEEGLIDIAMHATAAQIETTCAAYRRTRVHPNADGEVPADLRRFMHRTTTASGMIRIEMQVTPEQAEVVWAAMQVALDAGREGRREAGAGASAGASDGGGVARHEAAEQGVAALAGASEGGSALAIERGSASNPGASAGASDGGGAARHGAEAGASAGGVDGGSGARHEDADQGLVPASVSPNPATPARALDPSERVDALVSVAQAFLEQRNRTHGSGFELVMMTSPGQLESGPDGVGGFLRDGTPIPQHVARMLSCDCARVEVTTDASGQVLNVGRSRRTIPSAIMRALWIRDGGCRVPGCSRKHHLHAHHIEHWAEGGETKLGNLALLCPGHHALVHEGQLSVAIIEGKLECRNQHGLVIRAVPGLAFDELEHARRWVDAHEGGLDAELLRELERGPRWDGSRLDLRAALDWMFGAEQRAAA